MWDFIGHTVYLTKWYQNIWWENGHVLLMQSTSRQKMSLRQKIWISSNSVPANTWLSLMKTKQTECVANLAVNLFEGGVKFLNAVVFYNHTQ